MRSEELGVRNEELGNQIKNNMKIMKKLLFPVAAMLLMMGMTACGNDEPQDQIWYASIPLVFHVSDPENEELTNCQAGGVYAEMNIDKGTATLQGSIMLGDNENLSFDLADLHVRNDANHSGYIVTPRTESVEASGHMLSELEFFVDMRQEGLARHYFHAVVDGRYEVNGLLADMGFGITESEVTPVTGNPRYLTTGKYLFSITQLTGENKLSAFTVSGLDVYPMETGITYQGLKLEPTYEGYRISMTGEGIEPKEGGSSKLLSLEADINVHDRSFTAAFEIAGSSTVTASGTMF